MDDPKRLAVQVHAETGKQYLVSYEVACPVCRKQWIIQFRETVSKMADIPGAVGESFKKGPGKSIRVNTTRWGTSALCGNCFARRLARIGETNFLNSKTVSGWTQKDEQTLFGNLKYQQGMFHAVATVLAPATGAEELVDEQRDERERIIGKNNTFLTEARAKDLGLEGWMWRTDA